MMAEQGKSGSLPPIDEELTGRPRHQLPQVPSRSATLEDRAVEQNTTQLGRRWAAVSSIRQQDEKPVTLWDSVRLNIPQYLNRKLALDAAERDCTKTHLILQALARAGYEIDPRDMVPDRRMKK